MREAAARVRDVMRADPRVIDPHLNWGERMPSLRLEVDQARARALGLTPQDIAQTLQTLVGGATVTTLRVGEERVDVVARAMPSERAALDRLEDLTIATRDGAPVPVGQVARVIRTTEEPIIWRKDREVVVTALADVADGVQPPDVSQSLWPKLASIRDIAAARLSHRDGRSDRGSRRRATARSSRSSRHDFDDADAADDPDAELLASRDRVLHRAARHRRRVARAEPRRPPVRLRCAARA